MTRKKTRRPANRPANHDPNETASVTPKPRRWLKKGFIALALCLPAVLAYSNSFGAGFTLDNGAIILGNPVIQTATSTNVGLIFEHTYWWPSSQTGLYRPITTLSYLFNYAVLGNRDDPFGYHVINLFLHCINVLLVYLLARRFIQGAWLAELIAMAWAVHPVLTESVTNIVGRADLFAGTAILGGILLYLKTKETAGWTRVGYFAGLLVITTVGVFSKENAVALLGVVILYEATFWKEKGNLRAAAWGCLAIAIPIGCLVFQRSRLLARFPSQHILFLENPLIGARFIQQKVAAIGVMARYVWKLAWPAILSADYSYNQISLASGTVRDWIGLGVIGAILAIAVVLFRRNKTAFFFMGFAFIVFVPTSNLLFNIGTIMAERFLYLPAIGFTVCVALLIHKLAARAGIQGVALIAMALIIGAWGIRTFVRNKDWRDDSSLAIASVKTSPESYKTHMALALCYYNKGPNQNIDAAIAESEKSLAILKDVPDDENVIWPYLNASLDYRMKGDISLKAGNTDSPESKRDYEKALEILLYAVRIDKVAFAEKKDNEMQSGTPESQTVQHGTPNLYFQLTKTYLQLGDTEKAYRTALYTRALSPELAETSFLAAQAAESSGKKEEAAEALMVGYLYTQSNAFLPGLNSLYRRGLDPAGCGLTNSANGPVLNSACAPVHAEICSAYADIIQILKWNLKEDVADQTKSVAIRDFGCTQQVLAVGRKIQEIH
jgi:tetratricopeptide (TPR) repeat protein